jgi:hypothetical protein
METLVCSIFSHGGHVFRRIKMPSFVKFSSAVSEENIFKEKFTDGRTDDGRKVMTIPHLALWAT